MSKERVFTRDDDHDVAVVIPTCGEANNLTACVTRVARHQCGKRVHLVISLNPLDEVHAEKAKAICETALEGSGLTTTWVVAERPLGFGGAVNKAIDALREGVGIPPVTIILNDDTRVAEHWLDGLCGAFSAKTFRMPTDPDCNEYPLSEYGKVGLVGPVSNYVWRDQRIEPGEISKSQIDSFTDDFWDSNQGNYLSAEFISGFCMGVHRDLLAEFIENDGWLFDPIYSENVGGFEDDDACKRADLLGYRSLIAGQTYVHHLGSKTIGDMGIGNGLKNWPTHLKKWESYTQRDQHLAATYRVKLETINDLLMFKASLQGAAHICDSISVLFTGSLKALSGAFDLDALLVALDPEDRRLVEKCNADDRGAQNAAARDWLTWATSSNWHAGSGEVAMDFWDGLFNERDERNAAIRLSHQFSPDWIISIDHDEVFEKRVQRSHVERLMKHPDPAMLAWDFTWMNHWNSTTHIRIDDPWGDGGANTGGMRGWRMYRHNKAAPRQVIAGKPNGLHCGNIPAFSVFSTRVSNMRFHHFGYLRPVDRMRKAQRYVELDPEGDTMSARPGRSPYQHLVDEHNMILTPTPQRTGIAFTGLVHLGENAADLARVLSQVHGVCDSITLVWTDTDIDSPSEEFETIGRLHGVEWVRHKFEMDLSACRNAGLQRIRENEDESVGWLLTLDLDEFFQDDFHSLVNIRRMAEHPHACAWMFQFINSLGKIGHDQKERSNHSATIRMFKLDNRNFHWSGRVHEGISKSMMAARKEGLPITHAEAPFTMLHVGLNQTPEAIYDKLEKYAKMLVSEIEDDPDQVMPWVSLALHFMNDGQVDNGLHCFNCAMVIAGDDIWFPRKELAMHHLRLSKELFRECDELVPKWHPYSKIAAATVSHLDQIATAFPFIGRAINGEFGQSGVTRVPGVLPTALREESATPEQAFPHRVEGDDVLAGDTIKATIKALEPDESVVEARTV